MHHCLKTIAHRDAECRKLANLVAAHPGDEVHHCHGLQRETHIQRGRGKKATGNS